MSLNPFRRSEESFERFSGRAYRDLIIRRERETQFWILAGFLPTFIVSRILVRISPTTFLKIDETHVHHFIYGIIILVIAGFLALTVHDKWKKRIAGLYGIGLALAFDEFGLWLNLTTNYYNRISFEAIIIILAILISVVYFAEFWSRLLTYLWRKVVGG